MKTNEERLSLTNLLQGAVVERFDIVLQEVLDNVHNLNCDADAVREITVKVKIKPSLDRDLIAYSANVVPKLAPLSSVVGKAVVDKDVKGNGVAHEIIPFIQQELPQNVTPINERKTEK
jgi:hypothetical protein